MNAMPVDNERMMRMALEVGRIGVFEVDLATGLASYSPSLQALWGTPEGFPEGFQSFDWRYIHQADVAKLRHFFENFLQQTQEQECEFRVVRPDGTERCLLWRARPIRNETGALVRFVGTTQDVTRLRLALEAAEMVSWEVDLESGSISYSSNLPELAGSDNVTQYQSLDAFLQRVHPEDRDRTVETLNQTIRTGSPFACEYRVRLPDETWHWLAARGRGAAGPDGRFRQIFGVSQDITERKKSEVELASAHNERERALRLNEALLSAMPAPVFYKDLDGRYLGCNHRFAELMGVTAEQIRGKTVEDLWPHQSAEAFRAKDAELLANRGQQFYEYDLIDKNGQQRPVIFAKSVFYSEASQPAGIMGIILDITERKKAEEALSAEATWRRMLIDSSRDGIVILDPRGKVFEANRRFADMLGRTLEEVKELHVWDWDRDWPRERVLQTIRELGAEGAHFETRHWRKDGTFIEVELSNSAAEVGGQKLVFCVCHDITERKAQAAELARARDFYLNLLENAPSLVWRAGTDAKCDWFNSGWLKFTGRRMEQELGDGWAEGVHPEDFQRCVKHYLDCFGRREAFEMEYRLRRADGEYRWISDQGVPFKTLEGKFGGYIGYCFDITERRQATEALAEREQIFSSIVSQAADAIAIFDTSSRRFVEFNTAAHEGLGYTREQFAKFGVSDIQGEHTREVIEQNNALVQERGGIHFESKHRHRDGTLRDVRVSIQHLHVGNHNYLAAVWTDITDRKRAEVQLGRDRLRTEFLLELHQRAPQMSDRELFDHVLDRAVKLTDSAIGFFHQVSEDQRSIQLTTWNQEALKNCTAAFDTHYALNEAGNWVDCVRQQKPVVYNDYANSPNQRGLPEGHAAVQRFMSIPVIREGKVRIIFGVGNKTTDYTSADVDQLQVVANELHKVMLQRAAQNQLLQSEQRFRHLVETAFDWIWEVDATGTYTYSSPKAIDLIGYHPKEILGRTPFELMPDAEAERVASLFRECAARKEPFSAVERTCRHKKGHQVMLESRAVPMLDDQGQLLGYRGIDRDVTERRQLETQLRQAQKLEAIGQLAGGVAHDFNNILAAILMQLGLLQMGGNLESATKEVLHELEAEARRAASLTRQLLMFSRRSVLEVKLVDLNDVITNLLKMLRRLIGEQVKLFFQGYSGHLPLVSADVGMLEQVIMNLIVNARDAMPKGGSIIISTSSATLEKPDRRHAHRLPGTFGVLSVSDTGIGMDQETLERIFEPFFTTKEPGRGTGLGLATVHGIVAQHRGWVEVESEIGKGTTFRVYLPAQAEVAKPSMAPLEVRSLQKGRETILLVEDEVMVRKNVAHNLRLLGYRVIEAANGQEAMALWQKQQNEIDLLFTDMVMPEGLTGLELAERLQLINPTLKVIISSGYSAEIVQSGGLAKSGILYLPKPYEVQTLANIIRGSLDGKK